MSVAVIVPYRGNCSHRERAWRWVREQYRRSHPDWQVILSPVGTDRWVKAEAVMPAVAATDAEYVLVADADVWCDGLGEALDALRAGATWAIPHTEVRRLSEDGTDAFLTGSAWTNLPVARQPYIGVAGGGFLMARRETILSVPMDPRFVGWGGEDQSWGLALHCLLGPRWRGTATLIHLWHPPAPRINQWHGSAECKALVARYHAARRNPDQMAQLLEEIHVHFNAHQQDVSSALAG